MSLMLRLTPYGRPQTIRYPLLFAAVAMSLWAIGSVLRMPAFQWAAAVPVLGLLFILRFFRDPERIPGGEEGDLVSPADGKVTDIVDAEHPYTGKGRRIGIFLSVFDVHVNRSPVAGTVEQVRYIPGAFLDARNPECSKVNEANEIGLAAADGSRFLVKQISGAIARRIVCAAKVGDRLGRGERFGMIKFGSRTELTFDPVRYEAAVAPGDVVRGGETVLARRRAAVPARGAAEGAAR